MKGGSPLPSPFFLTECDDDDDSDIEMGRDGLGNGPTLFGNKH